MAVCPTPYRRTRSNNNNEGENDSSNSLQLRQSSTTTAANQSTSLIKIIDETDDLIILDKPGTLPIHPCGGYHLNSLISILEGADKANTNAARQSKKYFNIHRLDRLTSGLVILAKSSPVAKRWSQCIRQRECQKYYLARVRGRFPKNLTAVNGEKRGGSAVERLSAGPNDALPKDGEWPIVQDENAAANSIKSIDASKRQNAHGYWITDNSGKMRDDVSLEDFSEVENTNAEEWLDKVDASGSKRETTESDKGMLWLHLACPTRVAEPKIGVCEAGVFQDLPEDLYLNSVKPAQTAFGVIKYDVATDSTLVLCRPVTGRTHQIRLHCQYLGHPIANDPNYGGEMFYANHAGKEACARARKVLDTSDASFDSEMEAVDRNISDVPATEEEIDQLAEFVQREDESVHDFVKRTCVWCARCKGRDEVEHCMLEFLVRSRGIWLHAFQYSIPQSTDHKVEEKNGHGERLSFRTGLPPWGVTMLKDT